MNMQGKHTGKARAECWENHRSTLVCCTAGSPGRRAGRNLLRAGESREQGRDGKDTPRGRRRGDDVVPRRSCLSPRLLMSMRGTSEVSCGQVAPSTLSTSPAPPPRSNAHMFRHGKCRPRHPLQHWDHAHHPFLFAAGRTKPGRARKAPCRHGRGRDTRALGIRVHGSIDGKFKPVTASVACVGRARRPSLLPTVPCCSRQGQSQAALGKVPCLGRCREARALGVRAHGNMSRLQLPVL